MSRETNVSKEQFYAILTKILHEYNEAIRRNGNSTLHMIMAQANGIIIKHIP